jgi:hypothetical protein
MIEIIVQRRAAAHETIVHEIWVAVMLHGESVHRAIHAVDRLVDLA